MKWTEVRDVKVGKRSGVLWRSEHNYLDGHKYAVTLYRGDMIREPRDYEACDSEEMALSVAVGK